MRPRSFDRGNKLNRNKPNGTKESFNEAAIFRSRKPGDPIGCTLDQRGFNEAAIFRSRKPAPSCWLRHRSHRFNEAAIFRSRKRGSRRGHELD